jgi:hypothetical protein
VYHVIYHDVSWFMIWHDISWYRSLCCGGLGCGRGTWYHVISCDIM